VVFTTQSQRYRKAQEKHIGTAKLITFLPSLRANTNTTVRKRYTRNFQRILAESVYPEFSNVKFAEIVIK
jgi:hypothetical protein